MSSLSQTNLIITNKSSLVVLPIANSFSATQYTLYVYQKPTGVYYLRLRLKAPDIIRDNPNHQHGSCSLSLRTKYRREAMSISKEIQRLLAYYQADNPNATYEELRGAFRQFVEDELGFSYKEDVLDDPEQQGLYVGLHGDQIETVRKAMVSYPLTPIQHKFLANDVIPFHEAAIQRLVKADSSELLALLNKYEQLDQPAQPVVLPNQPSDSSKPVVTIRGLIAEFINEVQEGWKESTRIDNIGRLNNIIDVFEYLGLDTKDIRSLVRTDFVKVRDVFVALPKNRKQKCPNTPLGELLDRPDKSDCLDPNTVNGSYIRNLNAIFSWAERNDYVHKNLASGLEVSVPNKKQSDYRAAFSKEQLVEILKSANDHSTKPPHGRPWKKWAPLLAVITGSRCTEVAQLQVKDIKTTDSGVVYIDINEELDDELAGNKSVKNAYSVRSVPLVDGVYGFVLADFLNLVESRRQAVGDSGLLFDGLTDNGKGYGKKVSTWFNRTLLGKLIPNHTELNLSLHSTRHSFTTALKHACIEVNIAKGILGHSSGTMAYDRYGKAMPIDSLAEAIRQAFLQSDTVNNNEIDNKTQGF